MKHSQRFVLRVAFAILAANLLVTLHAQEFYYVAAHSGTADAVTVQQPATGAKNVRFRGALVSCSANCTITLSQNGAAATTTALAPTPLNLSPPSATKAFSASNVGAGTTIRTYTITDTNDHWIELGSFTLAPGINSNLTVAGSAGTVSVSIYYVEI